MSANAHAVRSSPFTRSASALFVLLIVAALVIMSILAPMSARADEAPPLDETASSDVAPANEVSLVVQEPAPVSPPAPDPVPEPVVAPAPPATPVVDPVVETPTSTDVTAPATEADVEDVTDNSTDAQDPAVTNDAEPTPEVAPAAEDEPTGSVFDPTMFRTIYQAADCQIGLFAVQNIPANVEGAFWQLAAPDDTQILGPTEAPVQSGVNFRVAVTQSGIYDAAISYPSLDKSLYVGAVTIQCDVQIGSPYVKVSNELAVGGVETGTVSFDYEVSDSVDNAQLQISIFRQGEEDSVATRPLQVSDSGHVSEDFDLPAGEYIARIFGDHNYGVDVYGWGPLTEDLPFTVTVKEDPTGIVAPKPTVDDGNIVTIPVKDGVEYFDVETGETVTGEITLTDPGICIGARSDDPYGDKVTGGPWCIEFLPEDTYLTKYEFTLQCTEKAWYKHIFEAPVTFVRGEDGKVDMTIGDFKEVYVVKLDPEEYPVTDEDLATCPVKPVDPVDPVDPTTPTTPSNPVPVNNGGGSKGAVVVKADSLATTGGDSPLGLIVGGGLLFALGLPLTLRRRRANKA